jgi:hypothetical protein
MAVEEDPKPRACGIVLPQARCPYSKISQPYQRRADDQMALISRQLCCAFSGYLDLVAMVDHREVDPFPPVVREPEAIKPWPKICTRGRNLHRHRPTGAQDPLFSEVRTHGLLLWIERALNA